MKALLWKEFRERRLWLVPLIISIIVPVLAKQGYVFCGDIETMGAWPLPSWVIALLLGMGAYSSELAWSTVDFLYSRPAGWKRILFAKLAVAVGMIAVSVMVGAILFRLTLPAPYVKFVTLPFLLGRMGIAVGILSGSYILGAICSVVLPGMVGAVLVYLAVSIGAATEMAMIRGLTGEHERVGMWPSIAWFLGVFLAALVLIRFGITLSLPARVKRYSAVIGIAVVVLLPLNVIFPPKAPEDGFNVGGLTTIRQSDYEGISTISPSGRYAVVYSYSQTEGPRHRLIRMSDGTSVRTNLYGYLQWAGDTLFSLDETPRMKPTTARKPGSVRPETPYEIRAYRMDSNGRLIEQVAPAGVLRYPNPPRPSPDGNLLMLIDVDPGGILDSNGMRKIVLAPKMLRFFDVDAMRLLPLVIHNIRGGEGGTVNWWWETNTQVGYIDADGKRHIARVR